MRVGIETLVAILCLATALALVLVARPRGAESPRWLGNGGLAVVYPAIILVFIAFGCGLLVTAYGG